MLEVKELIDTYIKQAILHGSSTIDGDFESSNIAYDKLVKNVKLIYALDPNGVYFLSLLKHENDSVKLWAATHSLFINEGLAMSAIESLAKSSSILSFDASMVADEWQAGNLEKPF